MSSLGHLYLISEGPDGPIKIGHSVAPDARLATLQTGNARPLRIHASYMLMRDDAIFAEECLHQELEERALVGEWFDLSEDFISSYMPDFFLSIGLEPLR